MVLSMASKSVILAILVSRRKNHLDDPLNFLTRPQARYNFLNPVLSRLINDRGQN
jgi:hypothetical protein